jgi:hypothetical protein
VVVVRWLFGAVGVDVEELLRVHCVREEDGGVELLSSDRYDGAVLPCSISECSLYMLGVCLVCVYV